MKIVLAPDSFKGSLSSIEVANTMAAGILEIIPDAKPIKKPMADGGEGTMETLLSSTKGKKVHLSCTGPKGNKIETYYAISGETATIEIAKIVGLTMVPPSDRNPDHLTSYGVGEVMNHALNEGCTEFVMALGGSATNDGGIGLLQALGVEMYDSDDNRVGCYGADLHSIKKVCLSTLDVRWRNVRIKVACDVENSLIGSLGATKIYGPQKGLTDSQVEKYDNSMKNYGVLVGEEAGNQIIEVPGTGAAGGLAFALLAIGADLISGAKLVAETIQLDKIIQEADLVLTGEGQSDEQTLYGKAPGYVAEICVQHETPVVLLSGSLAGDLDVLRKSFSGCFSIINAPMSLNDSIENAGDLLYKQTKQVMNLIKQIK
ncbi:glycerate kinase [Virgibacillus sp. SK37]|uniref:glycerate kinase n=1 Tax=Virgibacillus sp. SK37 TaxID=403957 RepID=UPI0004D19BD0|nr:glycerate kinase [Virgibacillus sp. SK37]AIF44245.1 glycerate kinase [Virgibacillus sp. SK37]